MPTESPRVAGVILAAGLSSRAGPANKLLLPLDARPLVWWAVQAATRARLDPVVLVTAPGDGEVRAATADFDVVRIENDAPGRGLASSLVLGVGALAGWSANSDPGSRVASIDAAVILLGDMPWVRSAHVERLVAAVEPEAGHAICVPTYEGRRGNPVVWGARYFDEIATLRGDQGARVLLDRHRGRVREVPMDDPAVLRDIDTLEEWRTARGSADS